MIVEIGLKDVRVGDVLTQMNYGDDGVWYDLVDHVAVDVAGVVHIKSRTVLYPLSELSVYMRFRVERDSPAVSSYPHVCRRCSAPAYYGAVPAAFECSSGGCPAR